MFCLHICVCTNCVAGTNEDHNGEIKLDPLGLAYGQLQAAMWVLGT